MYQKKTSELTQLIIGIFLIIVGILMFNNAHFALEVIFRFIGIGFLGVAFLNIVRFSIAKFEKKEASIRLSTILTSLIAGFFILIYGQLTIAIFGVICGVYLLVLATIHGVNYILARVNKTTGRFYELLLMFVYLVFGVLLCFSPYLYSDVIMNIIGIYFVLYGVTSILDVIRKIVPPRKKNKLKRGIRIALPVFIEMLLPRVVLEEVNGFLIPTEEKEVDALPDYEENKIEDIAQNLEVFVHVSKIGFGMIGHIDLFFDGVVISYGNYDGNSVRFKEFIGDGVVFFAEKEEYIPFAIQDSKKTLFGFGLHLNDEQEHAVRMRIESLKELLVEWNPPKFQGNDDPYAARLYNSVTSQFYKFKEGKFKTYFVVGTNCGMLADYILGGAGIDRINGIITPGTYLDYLNTEYESKRNLVVSKKIYN